MLNPNTLQLIAIWLLASSGGQGLPVGPTTPNTSEGLNTNTTALRSANNTSTTVSSIAPAIVTSPISAVATSSSATVGTSTSALAFTSTSPTTPISSTAILASAPKSMSTPTSVLPTIASAQAAESTSVVNTTSLPATQSVASVAATTSLIEPTIKSAAGALSSTSQISPSVPISATLEASAAEAVTSSTAARSFDFVPPSTTTSEAAAATSNTAPSSVKATTNSVFSTSSTAATDSTIAILASTADIVSTSVITDSVSAAALNSTAVVSSTVATSSKHAISFDFINTSTSATKADIVSTTSTSSIGTTYTEATSNNIDTTSLLATTSNITTVTSTSEAISPPTGVLTEYNPTAATVSSTQNISTSTLLTTTFAATNSSTASISNSTSSSVTVNTTSAASASLATSTQLSLPSVAASEPKPKLLSPELSEINSGSMDWVELYNPHEKAIDLSGFTLVGDKGSYNFTGDCGKINALEYLLLVDKDAENPEYKNGDCKLPHGIKTKGHLELVDANGNLVEEVEWKNVAYVSGHSYAKTESGDWAATSTQTPFGKNIFTDEITMPTSVDFSSGLHDREIAYIQNPPLGSITNVNLRVYSYRGDCECYQYEEAHNDEKCKCSWQDVNDDSTGTDLEKIVMPCSVSMNVDGAPEFWYDNVNAANSSDRKPRVDDNCNVAVRGGFTRGADIKSYNIKIEKKIVPRTWRGLKRLNMVKMPWDLSGGAVSAALYEQFAQMEDWNGMRHTIANLTVTVVDPDTEAIMSVDNLGRYSLFENLDEDSLDRHGQAARTEKGDRLESHLYKLNEFDFSWHNLYEDLPAVIDETDEAAIFAFNHRLEAKDSDNTLKLQEALRDLNDRGNMSFVDAVHKHFDLDNLANYVAVNVLVGDTDHSAKNSYIYSTTGTDKWYMTPWDYDASWNPMMDLGPQASSPQRYQDHYLFRGILFHDELRKEFLPKYKQKIRDLQAGFFKRGTIESVIEKHAKVVEPFFVDGKVDRDLLGIRPWDKGEDGSGDEKFDPLIMNYNLSPRTNIMGQFDFITQAVHDYTYADPPPPMFDSIMVEELKGSNATKFRILVNPVFSPAEHDLKTVINIYNNRPFDEDLEPEDTDNIYEDRFYEPKWADVVLAKTVPATLIAATEWDNRFVVELNCADVQACADTQCWVTSHTIDLVTDVRSAGGSIDNQPRFEGHGCSF